MEVYRTQVTTLVIGPSGQKTIKMNRAILAASELAARRKAHEIADRINNRSPFTSIVIDTKAEIIP